MSLKSSAFSTKRRNLVYGLAAVCLFSLIVIGAVAKAQSSASAVNPTPSDTPAKATEPIAVGEIPEQAKENPQIADEPPSEAEQLPETTTETEPAEPATVAPAPEPTPPIVPATIRNLALFENAGTLALGTTATAREAALSQTRNFLLRKWNERQPGRIAIAATTPTGRPQTRNLYVERNPQGTWRITLETEGRPAQEFYVVEEIGVTADGRPILEPGPGSPQAISRALHLKSNLGAKHGVVL